MKKSFKEKLGMRSFCVLLSVVSINLFAQDVLLQQKAARLYQTAVDLMAQNQFGAARENLNQYLTISSASSTRQDAEYYRAICSLNLYHADAEKQIREFIDRYPANPKASLAYAELANFFYNEKNYKKAVSYYAKADFSALTPLQQNTAHFRWGYSLFSQKILKEALDQFNFVKAQGGQYGPASSYYAGFVEYSQADYANALTDLKRAEQAEAYASIVPYLIANVYYKQNDYDALLAYVKSISSKTDLTNADEIALLSAEASYKKGDFKNALQGYDNYLAGKESTASKSVLLRAGYSAYVLNDDKKALDYLKNSFADVDSVGFYSSYYLGLIYLKNGQKPMAQSAFDIARKYTPDQTLVEESSFQYAKVSYEIGQPDKAIAEFERNLKSFPAGVHVNEIKELLSQAYVNANNYNKAIDYIESLPTRAPAVVRAYQKATMLKGMDLFNQENYDQAILYFEKSLEHPTEKNYVAEAAFWNGEAYSLKRKYDDAAKNYVIVIEGEENPALLLKARYGLGYAYFNMEKYDKALFSFREFVLKSPHGQPNLADATLRLADCYYVSKSYSEGLTYYRKAMSFNSSDNDYAHFQAGNILGVLGKYGEAKNELEQVIKNYSSSRFTDQARFQLAQLEFEQGHYAEAKDGYSALIASSPSSPFTPVSYVRRAASYFNLKEYNKTASDYITVIEHYPNHPAAKDVLLPLQEALNLANRSDEFEKYLAMYKQINPDAKGIESVEFEAAKNLFFNQQYQNAIKNFDAYAVAYPQSTHLAEAKYYQAESYYRLKETEKALPLYYALDVDTTFSLSAKVTARIAELEFKQKHFEKAIPYYQLQAREASNKKEQFNAWNGLMESYYALSKYDSVQKYAQLILEKGSVNAGAQNKASLFMGKAAMGKGDYETAKDEFLATINTAQDEYGAEAKYHLAEIFYNTKDYKQCYETLLGLNSDFSSYTEWVGKSYLLIAEYFLAINDSYQAKATLQSLVDNFPLDEIKNQATAKLKEIEEKELKQQPVKSDTTDKN